MKAEPTLRQELLGAPPSAAGERLDLFLTQALPGVSRKAIKRALDGGQVFVNGTVARRAAQLLAGGETLRITLSEPASTARIAEPEVLLVDEAVLALNKPAGMASHPTGSGRIDALSWASRWLRQTQGQSSAPILLHRLDADTSGVLLLARSAGANRSLSRQFADRELEKGYLALVAGLPPERFAVENYLRSGKRGRTCSVHSGGQRAETAFVTLGLGLGFALVEARPKTGRTHQIRVHLAESGYPLLGDQLYGGPEAITAAVGMVFNRHLLHARRLRFIHPDQNRPVVLEAPLPEDFHPLIGLLTISSPTSY